MTTKTVLSKQRETTQAIFLLTVNQNSRFEFIFTNMQSKSTKDFQSVYDIYRFDCLDTKSLQKNIKFTFYLFSDYINQVICIVN